MEVKIITDSACDLSQEAIEKFAIEVVPLTVQLDDEIYEDGKSISPKAIYDAMREGKAPKTSQITPLTFKETFESYAKEKQPCLYLGISSELSGTFQSAKIAGKEVQELYPDWELELVDTKCVSLGIGLIAVRAAQLAQKGNSMKEILEMSEYHANHMEHIFTVDDLEYLYRGGRVSRTTAFVGSLLKIKPLLHVEDGKLVPLEKIRGSKKVLKRMLDIMEERGEDLSNQPIGISHGDSEETANQLAEMIQTRFQTKDIHIEMVGSSIGAHAGPGTIAVFFLNGV